MASWNTKSPSVRRILADVRELARDPSDQYAAKPLEENMFEWHFAIRGPQGTDYEGGIYHGRIVLPKDYPFKPPSIMLLTPNGRWEVKQKICLSISSFHPEQWQPAWGIRTILEALISFMVTPGEGAIGAIDCSPELRRKLARESLKYSHPLMPKIPELNTEGASSEATKQKYADQVKQLHLHVPKKGEKNPDETKEESPSQGDQQEQSQDQEEPPRPSPHRANEARAREVAAGQDGVQAGAARVRPRQQQDPVDKMLHHVSIGLMMAIFAILYRKALQLYT